MLENIREMSDFPATPQIRCGTVGGFFRRLEAELGDRLPTWNGELYLENHRGTYTTQSHNKSANRQSEFLLHDAEFLAAFASVLDSGYRYPHVELHRAWKLVCLNQFHDILPGSSATSIYIESQRQYAEVREIGESVRDSALASIAKKLGGDVLVVNPTSFGRSDLASWPHPGLEMRALQCADGSPVPVQSVEDGLLLGIGYLPPYSVTPLFSAPISAIRYPVSEPTATPTALQNEYLLVELSAAGDIIRLHDKLNDREVLPVGTIANQFQVFEDRPINPDAWDIDIFYDDKRWLAEPAESVRVVENGPLRATLEVRRRILNSDYIQRISLSHNSPRLDFDTTIRWRERHILLKVAFPIDVLAPQATYEIQWGNVQRPTHRNTSWDWARFETCAQKWVDLSEGGYGVSLLNDCKYGHDIHNNVIRLSLLRSPTVPDPEADRGQHRFAYSLLPHDGHWDERTVVAAYALNDPLIVWATGRHGQRATGSTQGESFISVDLPNVVIETIKQAEDSQGVIVRLYESQRKRGEFRLTTAFPMVEAWRTNLLEENQERLETQNCHVRFHIKPYQIVTLRLLPK
jgi:alpha-mannosidase